MVKPELSIVVPAYNECLNLPLVIDAYKRAKKGVRFQLVIVDNGSSDGTAEYLETALKKKKTNSFIKVVTVTKNIGYGYGIYQGLLNCDAEAIGWSHADMQCPAEDVFKGYELLRKQTGNVLVKGHRVGRHWNPMILTKGLEFYASALLLKRLDDINGQPKLFDRALLETFHNPPLGFTFDLYVQYKALKKGHTVVPFGVHFLERARGVSKGGELPLLKKMPVIRQFLIDVAKMRVGKIR